MRLKVLFIGLLLFGLPTLATPFKTSKLLKVAVVDTGLDLTDSRLSKHLCKNGHKDFTGTGLEDTITHGTHIVGLIERYAEEGNYCLLIYKTYSVTNNGNVNMQNEISALKEAIKNGAKIINLSSGGPGYSEEEKLVIYNNPNVKFVVAAGNDSHSLDVEGNEYYPASLFLNNEYVVANCYDTGSLVPSSNYGSKVKYCEDGYSRMSTLPDNQDGYMTGTSQSTAVYTGKLIRKMLNAK